jgi:uncharacterized protein (DUF1330 family)
MAVNPTGTDMKAFLAVGEPQEVEHDDRLVGVDGGAERYAEYVAHFRTYAEKVGAAVVYFGHGADPIVAEQGQEWDAVLLVSYPSRRAFSDMVRDPGYQEGTHLRTEALVEAVLQPTTPAGPATEP